MILFLKHQEHIQVALSLESEALFKDGRTQGKLLRLPAESWL